MMIRKAKPADARELKELYFEHLTRVPPREEQDMALWAQMLERFEKGILFQREKAGKTRIYSYSEYLDILRKDT